MYGRLKQHAKARGHILACSRNGTQNGTPNAEDTVHQNEEHISLPEIGENEAANIEPTEAEIEKVLQYIENRLQPKFAWLQLSEGKLFCTVRNIQGRVR